jgi:prevent-host-death family protein
MMLEVTVAEAKSKLSELIKRVEQGEDVTITRRGKSVVVLSALKKPLPARDALRSKQTLSKKSSVQHLRALRDET